MRPPHPSFRARQRTLPKTGSLWDRLLDPLDLLAETVFSILILLTFTLAFRIFWLGGAEPEAGDLNELLIGALGAILAWGMIDGVMYALIAQFERGERHRLLHDIRAAENDEQAIEVIADDLDYLLEPITDEAERLNLYRSILDPLRRGRPRPIGFTREDLTGALGHVVVAVVSVLPSLIPLALLPNNFELAVRLSNIVSFIVLFLVGFRWGRYTGASPWKTGLLLVAVAAGMVLVAIPLGG